MRRFLRSIAVASLTLLISSTAFAQEYADEQGDLDLETEVIVTLTVAGEGYVADSVVFVVLTDTEGNEVDLGTVQIDDQGRFFGDITIPDGLAPGDYTITATGVTVQGATRILSGTFVVGGEIVLQETDDPDQTTTQSLPNVDTNSSPTTSMPDNPAETAATFLPLVLGDIWTWLVEGFGS